MRRSKIKLFYYLKLLFHFVGFFLLRNEESLNFFYKSSLRDFKFLLSCLSAFYMWFLVFLKHFLKNKRKIFDRFMIFLNFSQNGDVKVRRFSIHELENWTHENSHFIYSHRVRNSCNAPLLLSFRKTSQNNKTKIPFTLTWATHNMKKKGKFFAHKKVKIVLKLLPNESLAFSTFIHPLIHPSIHPSMVKHPHNTKYAQKNTVLSCIVKKLLDVQA